MKVRKWTLDDARRSWIFRATQSRARVLELRSSPERDLVIFRFEGELGQRSVRARSFLRHFRPVPP